MSLKRYRFTGKERDSETGLDYFGVRYYASWLGRWTSGDPGGFVDGLNLYQYTRNNPVNGIDREGYSTEGVEKPPPVKKKKKEEVETIERGSPLSDTEITVTADSIEKDPPKTIRNKEGKVVNPSGNTSDFADDWYAAVEGNLVMTNGTDYQVWNIETGEYDIGREPREWKASLPLEDVPYDQLQLGDIYRQGTSDSGGVNYANGFFGDSRKLQYAGNSSWIELEGFSSVRHAELLTDAVTMVFPLGGGGVSKLFRWLGKFYAGKKLIFAAKSIWKLPAKGPQSRGFVYERMLGLKGLMKASNFPTIDAFYKGVATSVKTMDLSAKSYQSGNAVYNTLKKYVDTLAKFKGKSWGGDVVRASDIKSKVLELGIPKGATAAQLSQLKNIAAYAKQQGIKFNYRVVK